jgi:hypothetical protein
MERGQYRHFMQKEIHEQPRAVAETLSERIGAGKVLEQAFGRARREVFDATAPCRSSPAARATTPGWWRAISSRSSRAFPAWSRSPASTATASRWCPRARCS